MLLIILFTFIRVFINVNKIIRSICVDYLDLYFDDGGGLSIKEKSVLNLKDIQSFIKD